MPSSYSETLIVSPMDLTRFVEKLLEQVRVPHDDAAITAHVLVEADLSGRRTHGVSRLSLYVNRIRRGVIAPNPVMRFRQDQFPVLMSLDGDNGLGPVVAWRAMEQAVRLSEDLGVGIVAVKRSNHAGAMSVYCEEAASRGHILMALTNSPPGMAPWGGRTPFLGTNPMAFGIPRGSARAPIIVDLATSVVARGNIIQAARLRQPIPPEWAIDENGYPTTDPEAALKGAVLPMAGAKGYALALVVEILSGVLSGSGVGPGVKNPYNDFSGASNVGHFFCAINPAGLGSQDEFYARIELLEEGIYQVPSTPGEKVRLPGDRALRQREDSQQHGIPVDRDLFQELNTLAEACEAPRLTPMR